MWEILELKYYNINLTPVESWKSVKHGLRPKISNYPNNLNQKENEILKKYEELMKKCWQKERKERPQSFSAIKKELQLLLTEYSNNYSI